VLIEVGWQVLHQAPQTERLMAQVTPNSEPRTPNLKCYLLKRVFIQITQMLFY